MTQQLDGLALMVANAPKHFIEHGLKPLIVAGGIKAHVFAALENTITATLILAVEAFHMAPGATVLHVETALQNALAKLDAHMQRRADEAKAQLKVLQ